MWPVGDGLPADSQPSPAILASGGWRDARRYASELVADRVEQVANAGPKNIRADRYGEGNKHDQQGVFSRCGAAFVTVKATD
jgi:hypothetical protein